MRKVYSSGRKRIHQPLHCALNEQSLGWKKKARLDVYGTWVELFCENPTTIKDALTCLDEGTFNFTETVGKAWETSSEKLDIDSTTWTEDVMSSWEGSLFYIIIII